MKIRENFAIKTLAFILLVISLTFTALSACGTLLLLEEDVYAKGKSTLENDILYAMSVSHMDDIYARCFSWSETKPSAEVLRDALNENADSNFRLTVKDEAGNILATDLTEEEKESLKYSHGFEYTLSSNDIAGTFRQSYSSVQQAQQYLQSLRNDGYDLFDIYFTVSGIDAEGQYSYDEWSSDSTTQDLRLAEYTSGYSRIDSISVSGEYGTRQTKRLFFTVQILDWSRPGAAVDNINTVMKLINPLYQNRYAVPAAALIGLFLSVLLLVFLCCAVGHVRSAEGDAQIALNPLDKIPLDLYAILLGGGAILIILLGVLCVREFSASIGLFLCGCAAVAALTLCLALFFSFVTRLKLGKFWRNTVIWYVLRFCWRCLRKLWRAFKGALSQLSLWWQAGILFAGIAILQLICILSGSVLLWFLEMFVLTPLLIVCILNMRVLQKGGEEIAKGNLDYQIPLNNMFPPFRLHGEHLNATAEGMRLAVEKQLKSERLKAELITNVSHDIKTPLTSIINYVDLLQKEDLSAVPHAAEYTEVLARQGARLKKLMEDLVEASKASTGNIKVDAQPTDLCVLLGQIAGEYAERLENAQLMLCADTPEQSISVLADGNLTWRVMDNLLSNVCKYAMPGTRVYLSAAADQTAAHVVVRNISSAPLNISGEELQERFVRGDGARNTEGSGLGLSIARSLVQLQNGTFDISIDGDLFKVTLTLPLAKN